MDKLSLRNVSIIYPNFSGKQSQYNPKGMRTFCITLEEDLAHELTNDGWNVKFKPPRVEDEDGFYFMEVKINYNGLKDPKIVVINKHHRKDYLQEEQISRLDTEDIISANVVLNPYRWTVNNKEGIKAYLRSAYIFVDEDEFETEISEMRYSEEEEAV